MADPWKWLTTNANGCMLWNGALHELGYGVQRIEGKTRKAHRIAWESVNGPIPADHVLHHLCHEPRCVNVDHLQLMTRSAHQSHHRALEGGAIGTICKCKRGHDYTRGKGCHVCRKLSRDAWLAANPERAAAIRKRYEDKRGPVRLRAKAGLPKHAVEHELELKRIGR